MMKAIETTATITEVGQLTLDTPLELTPSRRIRVIILMNDDDELEDDDTPMEIVVAGIRQGLHEARFINPPLRVIWVNFTVHQLQPYSVGAGFVTTRKSTG